MMRMKTLFRPLLEDHDRGISHSWLMTKNSFKMSCLTGSRCFLAPINCGMNVHNEGEINGILSCVLLWWIETNLVGTVWFLCVRWPTHDILPVKHTLDEKYTVEVLTISSTAFENILIYIEYSHRQFRVDGLYTSLSRPPNFLEWERTQSVIH